MPPPSLSTTTTTRSMSRAGAPSRPLESWRNARSPTRRAVGRPGPQRHAHGGGHDAVDPVGAAVGVHPHARPRVARTTRGRARASTRRRPARRRRAAPPSRRGPPRARSGRPRRRAGLDGRQGGGARLLPRRRARPRRRRASSARRRGRAQAADERGRDRRARTTSAVPCGSTQRPGPGDHDLVGPAARRPTPRPPWTPAACRAGRPPPGAARRPSHARAGSRRPQGTTAPGHAPHRGLRRGDDRPAEGRCAISSRARPGPEPAPATNTPAPADQLVDERDHRPGQSTLGDRAARPRRRRPRPAGGSGRSRPTQRLAEGEVQVHRPRRGARGRGERPAGQRPPPARASAASATPGAWNQRTAPPKRWVLVDRLRRADVPQLRGPVRGAHEHRHPGQVGLDDRRVQLGGGGAARGEHDGGDAGAEGQAEGQEAGAALVVVDVDGDARGGRPGPGPSAWSASPGATTAWVTPHRTHSSTSVAAKVAWTSSGGALHRATSEHTRRRARLARPDLPGSPHGPARRALGSAAACSSSSTASPRPAAPGRRSSTTSARTTRSCSLDAPGHGGSAEVRGGPADAGRPAGRGRRPRRPTSATRWAPASACTPPSPTPTGRAASCCSAAPPGSRTPPSGPPARTRTAPPPPASPTRASTRFLEGWLAQPLFAGTPPRAGRPGRPAAQHHRRPAVEPRAGRHRQPGAAVGPPRLDLPMPVLAVAGETDDAVRRARPTAWPSCIGGPTRAWRLVAGRGPRRPPRAARRLPRAPPSLAGRRPLTRTGQAPGAEPDPPASEQAGDELDLAGRAEHRDQRRARARPRAPAAPACGPAPRRRARRRPAAGRTRRPRPARRPGTHDEQPHVEPAGAAGRRGARPGCACPTPCRRGCRAGC